MDIANKIAELNTQTEQLVKNIEKEKEQIQINNRLVRKLATQLKRTEEILGIKTPTDGSELKEQELAQV